MPKGPYCRAGQRQERRLQNHYVLQWRRLAGVRADRVCKRRASGFDYGGAQSTAGHRESDRYRVQEKGRRVGEKRRTSMSKKAFDKIAAGLNEALAIMRGE